MKKYKVPIIRISYSFRDIEVFAKNAEEAEQKAIAEAGNYDFKESAAEYEIDSEPVLIK